MKNEYWYKELKSHIESVNSTSFKTILITGPHFYQVVTKANHLTTKIWVEWFNGQVKERNIKVEPIKRIGWLVSQKQYRRNIAKELFT